MSEPTELNITDSEVSATQALLKKKTTTKKVAVEITAEDIIAINATVIENLSKEESHNFVAVLQEQKGLNDFKLGGALRHMRKNGWHDGYDSFDAMIEDVYSIKKRKGAYLSAIYESLVENQIPWEKVAKLGWTKLNLIAPLLTIENVDEWVAKALALKTLQLEDVVKQYKAALEGNNTTEVAEVTSTVSTLTLKVHEDQKVIIREAMDKAKAEVQTEFDTVALESICIGYLGGSVNIAKIGTQADLSTLMKEKTFEEVLGVFSIVFPDVNITAEA